MAETFDDLEDELVQVGNTQDHIFEEDDEDDDFQPGLAQQEDDEEEEDAFAEPATTGRQPAAAAPPARPAPEAPAAGPTDVRAKLAALAQKKRQEAEEGPEGKRRGKGDKDGKGKRKRDKGSEKGDKQPKRPVRGAGGAETEPLRRRRADGEEGPQGSVDSRELKETEADQGFIDDEADNFAPGDEGGGSEGDDEDARLANAPEAEEGDEAEDASEQLFGRKKNKKKRETDGQMSSTIDDKIAKMEAAADIDMEEHNANRPAINKLKMLAEVEQFLAQRKYHELFIGSGGLGVLKAWLEPYKDGALPNVRVRSAILTCCKALPIDTARDEIKENLKKSQLGSRIMFLAQCPDETQTNRKTAVELVQKWSRPIFFDPEAEAEKKRAREEALRRARKATLEQARVKEEAMAAERDAKAKIKYGQQGYRWHASIPQTLKLDYVNAPQQQQQESAVSQAASGMQTGGKKDEGRFAKKMREVVRKQKGSNARAAVPSVEGRNIVLM